ncbi:MAG: PspC domain-containing protein [Bacteroidales bacterium]|nr:PspC domain-containing protein [Bacteroidales bacterium]
MKKTLDIGIGGKSFIIDEDAYARLKEYLDTFRSRLGEGQGEEVMNDIEARIAELLNQNLGSSQQSVSLALVESIISQLGMPDGKPEKAIDMNKTIGEEEHTMSNPVKKLYLDVESRKLGGVCSGLAAYFDVDVTLIRILFMAGLFCGGFGFWLYIIIWIVAPKALTPAQKCELRGWEANAENMAKFTDSSK